MAKSIQAPSDIRIASLEQKVEAAKNLMAPGSGTPWEDRGSSNVVNAFFKTAIMSMKSPVELFHAIRRPETTGDASSFAIASGFAWGISWLIHSMILLPYYMHREQEPLDESMWYFMASGLQLLIMPFAVLLVLKFLSGLFNKLAATELGGKAPAVLTFNVLAYTLGPSALALIPLIGPPIALLWIFILMCKAGSQRLHVSTSGTIIAVILSWVAAGAIWTGIALVVWLMWTQIAHGEYQEAQPEDLQHRSAQP